MRYKTLLVCLSIVIVLAACSSNNPSPVSNTATPPAIPVTSIEPVITELEVLRLAEPAETIAVVVRGTLPDGCYRLEEPRVKQASLEWVIEVSANRLPTGTCAEAELGFERLLRINTSGAAAGIHQVRAGDQQVSFSIPDGDAEALALPEATASPTKEIISQPQNQPTPTEAEVTDVPVSTPTAEACVLKAAFYADITVPDNQIFMEGEAFEKIWRIRNEGTCTWDSSYALVFAGGDILNAPLSIPLLRTPPEEFLDLSVKMTAPAGGGQFTGLWEFLAPDGRRFGVNSTGLDKIWVKIAVRQTLLGTAGETATVPVTASCSGTGDSTVAGTLLGLINNARTAAGLPVLSLNTQLSAAADQHSRDMACNNYLDHTGTDGSTWRDRIRSQGYDYTAAAENIYAGSPNFGGTSQGAFDWWMNSQVHRDNILSRKVNEIGIGYIFVADSQYGGYYTLVFGRRN